MTQATLPQASALRGRSILVVEDDYMIAQDTVRTLAKAGATALGPVPAVADALRLLAADRNRVDAALLDVNVRDGAIWPVVDALLARGVPLVLATGYDAEAIPQAYADLPRCEKPGTTQEIMRTLEQVLTQ